MLSAAQKAHKQSLVRNSRNRARKQRVKSFIKKVLVLLPEKKETEVRSAFSKAQSEIMRGVSHGTIKKNTASRHISKLAKKVKSSLMNA